MKRTISLLLCLLMVLGLAVPALALESGRKVTADEVVDHDQGLYTVRSGDKYGFYRADGTQLVPPTYRYTRGFCGGMAAVSMEGYLDEESNYFVDGKYGYVDASGRLAIPMAYDFATDFAEGRAFVMNEDGPLTMIDTTGKIVATFPDACVGWAEEDLAFHEGLAILPQGDFDQPSSYIAVDTAGKTVLTFTEAYVDFLNGFQDGMVLVSNSGIFYLGGPVYLERGFGYDLKSCGYRDRTGKLVVDYQYDDAYHFSGGMGPVGVSEDGETCTYGFIDTAGKVVVPPKYDNFYYFSDGVGTLFQDGRRAFVDATGKLLTGFDFESTWSFSEGLALTRSGGGIRVFDKTGKLQFQTNCTKGYSFGEGLSVLITADGRYGAVDRAGKVCLPFEYREIIPSGGGFLWVQRTEGVWEALSTAEVLKNQPDMPFADVETGEWYYDSVSAVYKAGLVNGKNATTYAPKDNVSLAESVSLAVRMDRLLKGETGTLPSTGGNWYDPYVKYAKDNGFEGVEFSSYGVAATRAQFAVIMANVLKNFTDEELQKNQVELGQIPDVTGGESYGAAVYALYRAGILAGSGNGIFRPGDNIQRSEMAAILVRCIDPSQRLSVNFN